MRIVIRMNTCMKKKVLFYSLVTFILGSVFCNCLATEKSNRVYFKINPEDRKILLPVFINDSVTANLEFDTGGGLVLDSTFCKNHQSILLNNLAEIKKQVGVGWSTKRTSASIRQSAPKLTIGNTDLKNDYMEIWNWKKYMQTSNSVGMFNIPSNDTINVWELNFENNYLEVHSTSDFKMPENCFVAPIVKDKNNPKRFIVRLAMTVKCNDGDTINLNGNFLIDTAMPWDVAILHSKGDLPFFNNRSDAIWTSYLNSYYRHYNTNATLFNRFKTDSLRIYSFEYPNCIRCNIIGQNFLKRFNVFFDLKNNQVGFQPIQDFHRVINPLARRFYYSTEKTNGKFFVTMVADYKDNYYKTAGLQKGDEIVAVNSKPYKDITRDERYEFFKKETLLFEIIRKGNPLKIIVRVDKNEKQGD